MTMGTGHRSTMLLTWTLLATLTVFECQESVCFPVRGGAAGVTDHPVGTFATRMLCEEQREHMQRVILPKVTSTARPGITITQQMAYRCEEKG